MIPGVTIYVPISAYDDPKTRGAIERACDITSKYQTGVRVTEMDWSFWRYEDDEEGLIRCGKDIAEVAVLTSGGN